MRIFLPEWADMVDPDYDFVRDVHSEGHKIQRWDHDKRIWEMFDLGSIPVDGVLVSRMVYERHGPFEKARSAGKGLRDFLRLPKSLELMGDCGAFGYVNAPTPPYGPKDTLEFYRSVGVDIGVTVDHLIVSSIVPRGKISPRPLTSTEREARWRISIDNALRMYDLWSSDEKYWSRFRLMGAIQGERVEDYQRAAEILVDAGFLYLGLGGLVRSPSREVRAVLAGVREAVDRRARPGQRVELHLFGIARFDLIQALKQWKVASIDSATMLRRAWMSAKDNYLSPNGEHYVALRMPPTLDKDSVIERLATLRAFDRGECDMQKAMRAITRSPSNSPSRHVGDRDPRLGYSRTFADKPWKRCGCPICRKIGIDVIVFRGNDRNRRRGFHNIGAFYTMFRRQIPKVAIVLSCSKKKDPAKAAMPAYARYLESPTFKAIWRAVADASVPDIFILSGRFGLIHWSQMIPNYDVELDANTLDRFEPRILEQLSGYSSVFFYGSGSYRDLFRRLAQNEPTRFMVFPSTQFANGRKLDILESNRQPKAFRREIERVVGNGPAVPPSINVFGDEGGRRQSRQSALPS